MSSFIAILNNGPEVTIQELLNLLKPQEFRTSDRMLIDCAMHQHRIMPSECELQRLQPFVDLRLCTPHKHSLTVIKPIRVGKHLTEPTLREHTNCEDVHAGEGFHSRQVVSADCLLMGTLELGQTTFDCSQIIAVPLKLLRSTEQHFPNL